MIRFIRVSYIIKNAAQCVEFTDPNDNSVIGEDYIRIDKSWAITSRCSRDLLIVAAFSNANKTKDPIETYPLPELNNSVILVLKNSADNFSSSIIDMDVWELVKAFNVTNFIQLYPWKDVNVITQYINGKCNNPVIAISGYDKIENTSEPNGFQEHYLVNTRYFRKAITPDFPHPIYRAYILQDNGNGTTTLMYEIIRRDGFNMLDLQHQVNPV